MQQGKIEHISKIGYFVVTTGKFRTNLKEGELFFKEVKPTIFLCPYIHRHLISVFNGYTVVSQKLKLKLKLCKTVFLCFDMVSSSQNDLDRFVLLKWNSSFGFACLVALICCIFDLS